MKPFSLIGKTFFRKSEISKLLELINHKDRVYKDRFEFLKETNILNFKKTNKIINKRNNYK